jgi:exopolysaccharide biosynthesis protein
VRVSRAVSRSHGFRDVVVATLVLAMFVVVTTPVSALSPGTRTAPLISPKIGASGLTLYSISGARFGVYTPIHVLTFDASQYSLDIGLANHAIDGGEQTPSSMCHATTGCVAAVNGDFFDVSDPGEPVAGDSVGGIIRNCVLLHTPETAHEQIDLDGESVTNSFNWSSTIDLDGTSVPITAINQELPMSYLNVNVPLAGTLLFTSLYALPTPTAPGRVTYEFTHVGGVISPTTINTTADLDLVGQTTKAVRVAAGDVDISAPADSALDVLSDGDSVTMTTTSTAGCNNIGGHPILLSKGVVGPINRADTYMATPYSRTVVGWTASGETVIMSVGGRDAKSGATMYQLVTILLSLDVVTALDLDGGGSTTLYSNGRVIYPTAKTERAVSTSLLVVKSS